MVKKLKPSAAVQDLQRREWRGRQAACRGTTAPKPNDKATAGLQGRVARADWHPQQFGLCLGPPPPRGANSQTLAASNKDVLSQCQPEALARFQAWVAAAPDHVKNSSAHPSCVALMSEKEQIRQAPWCQGLVAVLAFFYLLDREVGLQVSKWLLALAHGKKRRPAAPKWAELRLLLQQAPSPAVKGKPEVPDGLGHRAGRTGSSLNGPKYQKMTLPYRRLALIRAWYHFLVAEPQDLVNLPQSWETCSSTSLAACLHQLPNCGPYLAARVLGWLCVAGLISFSGGCLGPGATLSLAHLMGEDQQPQQQGHWPWTGKTKHQLTQQLAEQAGMNYCDMQAALCLWVQLGYGNKFNQAALRDKAKGPLPAALLDKPSKPSLAPLVDQPSDSQSAWADKPGRSLQNPARLGEYSCESMLVEEPSLTTEMNEKLEHWMVGLRQSCDPVANQVSSTLGFQHAAAFRALVELYASRYLLSLSTSTSPSTPERHPRLTAAILSLALKGCGQESQAAYIQLFDLVWSGVPGHQRADAELRVLHAVDYAGPRLLLPSH
jgi:hypothetical protein